MAEENLTPQEQGIERPTEQEAQPQAEAPASQEQFDPAQVAEWRKAYEDREAWQRANTQRAQEIAQWQEFVRLMEQHPDLAEEFAQKLAQRVGMAPPETEAPAEGEEGTEAEIPPWARELQQKIEEMEWKDAFQWADQQWSKADSEYQRVFGQPMPPGVRDAIKEHLAATGSIDPVASMYYVCRNDILSRQAQASQEAAQQAQAAIRGAVTEGGAGGGQERQIDFSKMSLEELERLGRIAATGEAESDYNPYEGRSTAQ